MINEPGYRLNVGLIVINNKGKLLLCKRKNINSWQFPQGGIDYGESPLKAARRELYEEVGIKKEDFENLPDFNYDSNKISNQSGFHTIKFKEDFE